MQDVILNVKFEKDIEKQYAILAVQKDEEYGLKMLQNNKLAGMLEVQIKNIDNKKWCYYNITKKSSLEQLLNRKQVSIDNVKVILMQIFQTIETARDFLLDEKNLILDTKMIYLSPDNPSTTEICYYPSYQKDSLEQLIGLLEVFLNQIDYKTEEKSRIEQFYRIYDKAREIGMTCKELWKEVQKEYKYCNNLEQEVKSVQVTPAFQFKRVETIEKQSDNFEKNKKNQYIGFIETTGFEKEKDKKGEKKKEEAYKNVIAKDNSKKQQIGKYKTQEKESGKNDTWNSNIIKTEQESSFGGKKLFVLCGILVFSCVIIGIAFLTNILQAPITGAIDYIKMGILCVIVAAMDLFIWKYLKQIETEEKMMDFHQKQNEKKPKDKMQNSIKNEKEELDTVIAKLEKADMGLEKDLEDYQPDNRGLIENEFWGKDLSGNNCDNHQQYSKKELQKGNQILDNVNKKFLENNMVEEPTILLTQEPTVVLKHEEKTWKLISIEEKEPKEILLKKFPFYLGKLQWNVDYAIDHSSISRVHSKFEKEGDILYMTDLNSTNGTYLNHIKLKKDEKREVKKGDEVSFADLKFRLESDG